MPKHGLIVIILILVLIGIISFKITQTVSLNSEIEKLNIANEVLVKTLQNEQDQFKRTVDRLQQELSQYTLDAEAYQCAIACKAKAIDDKAKEEESKIHNELKSDSSSDNQLDIARRMLNEFNRNK